MLTLLGVGIRFISGGAHGPSLVEEDGTSYILLEDGTSSILTE